MASALSDLAVQLSLSSSLPSQTTKDALQVLGLRASICGAREILAVSSQLHPYFHWLELNFPNAKKLLSDFKYSKDIQALLNASKELAPTGSSRSQYFAAPFCQALISKDFKTVDFDKHPLAGELFAFFWCVHTSIHTSPAVVVTDKLARLLKTSLSLVQSFWTVVEDHPIFGNLHHDYKEGMNAWIEVASHSILLASDSIGHTGPSLQEIKEGLLEACQLIEQLPPRIDAEVDAERGRRDLSWEITSQKGEGLSERERLTAHHNAFQGNELKILSQNIRSILEKDFDPRIHNLIVGAAPQQYLEATIIALALATGRSINAVLELPMVNGLGEHVCMELFVGKQRYLHPIWTRTLPSKEILKFPLPLFLKDPINNYFKFDGATTVKDCLPYSLLTWEERCFDWLEKQLNGSRRQINRRIRDALARALYQTSASSSLLRSIATATGKNRRGQESLSNYLDPFDIRTIDAYSCACTKIFNKYGAPKETKRVFKNSENFAVAVNDHRRIAQFYLKNISDAENLGRYVTHHNWLARYILMLLVVATGHRKSRTPFYFPWDILSRESLVFISDKLVVGSEARFVPIPNWISKLIENYRQHLFALADRMNFENPQLGRRIRHLAASGDIRGLDNGEQAKNASRSDQQMTFGFFFIIDENSNPITITTRDLEKCYSHVSTRSIGLFRKCVANYLWSGGLSGHQVEAFLGHNGEQHAFGESSAWSIFQWSNDIRSAQEKYLSERGWESADFKTFARTRGETGLLAPRLETSQDSYEGRKRSANLALLNARKIIRDMLPSDWFVDDKSTISDADILLLKRTAKERLSQDQESCEKVNQALAVEIERIRHHVGGTISSAIANLTRTEPGPVDVTSSRYYAIASALRNWWMGRVGNYLKAPEENQIDRLAHIGISLIIFDAVLDLKIWEALLSAISIHETRSANGCLLVRARIEKSSRIFEKSLILSPYTAAQIIGFELKHSSMEPNKLLIKEVTQRINKCLKSAPLSAEKFVLEQLMAVFGSWWLLRLPGAQFAVAKGEYSGSAPDIVSECAIYGISCTDSAALVSLDSEVEQIFANNKSGPKKAIDEINKLLEAAAGKFVKKEATSRAQRNRLMEFFQDEKYADLKQIACQQQIVSLMLDFLQYMIEEGGKRLDVLRFGSIRTYFSGVNSLIEILWDKNIEDIEAEDYNESYGQLLNNSSQSQVPISLFHKFLSATFHAPYSSVSAAKDRIAIQCRSALITPRQHEQAWNEIGKISKDDGQLIFHSKSYLCLGYDYGLRTREALGLSLNHVVSRNPLGFRIARNNVRDLKTKKYSLRIVTPLLTDTKFQKHMESVVELAIQSPVENESLFADTEFKNQLYSKSRIGRAVTTVLRSATGNLSVVPYSMRHSAATRLSHFSFRSPRKMPLTELVENSLKGMLDADSITACFDQGFAAWPFWIDRVGMYLGHSGVDTLLNTYWHTSHVCIAEQTWHASQDIHFIDQQLASMLGRDRSTILKQYERLASPHSSDANKPKNSELLISHYINKSLIPMLGDDLTIDNRKQTRRKPSSDTAVENESCRWIAYDRLLCARLDQGLTFAQLYDQSQQFYLGKKDARKFIDAYRSIVQETGFDDFEPDNSEILAVTSKRNAGCLRGAAERERGLTAAHRLSKSDDKFAEHLRLFVNLWIERTNPSFPWFVACSKDEVIQIIELLSSLGVKQHQFEFCHCHFDMSQFRKTLLVDQIDNAILQNTRISSGPKGIRVSEIGIRVGQESGAKIGDYRDTHRMALVLAAIVRASL